MRIAAHDLGSNSFHTIVVDVHPDGTFHALLREKEMLRLGDVVSKHGQITDEASDRATAALRRLKALADASGAEEHVACATSALREAANGPEVVERLEEETGLDIKVISGRDEARLIFAAIRASVAIDRPPALCLDLGGGSLEVSVGDHGGLQWCTSLRLGVARLAADLNNPARLGKDDEKHIRDRLIAAFSPVALAIDELAPAMLVVTSGTFCDLTRLAVAARTGAPVQSINNATVTRKELRALHKRLVELPAAERATLVGTDPRRADIIAVGSFTLLTALDVFGFDRFTAGEWALREGMVLDAISHHDPADWTGDPRAVRLASVLSLARRCNWNAAHGRHVAALATSLFDQTQPLHDLTGEDRELLEHAAFLHDIGEHVATTSHHKHSAYLVQHGELRGFSPDEVLAIAAIARYHRRSEPKAAHEPFSLLDATWQRRVSALAGFLRLADGFDRGHAGAVSSLDVTIEDSRVVIGAVSPPGHVGAELELWGARRKHLMLERLLGRTIEVVESAPAQGPSTPRRARRRSVPDGTG